MNNAISNDKGDGSGSMQSVARPQARHCTDTDSTDCGAPPGIATTGGPSVGERMGLEQEEEKRIGELDRRRAVEPMRSSCIESASLKPRQQQQAQPLTLQEQEDEKQLLLASQQQLPPQSDDWIQAGGSCEPPPQLSSSQPAPSPSLLAGNLGECSTSDPNCCPINGGSTRAYPLPVKGAITGQSQQEPGQPPAPRLTHLQKQQQPRELEVEWTGPSLFRRTARFSGVACDNSRSLCIRTSLVRSIKGRSGGSSKGAGMPSRDSIGRAIKNFVGDFRSNFNDNSKRVSKRELGAFGAANREVSGGTKRESESSDSSSCINIATSETKPLDKSSCKCGSSRGFLRASVSCQSAFFNNLHSAHQNQATQQPPTTTERSRAHKSETAMTTATSQRERNNESAACEELNLDRTIAFDQSSNNKRLSKANNMSSGGRGGCTAKNKCIVEDKMRKQQQLQQQQQPAPTAGATTTRCSSAARLEDRRPTYCSSVGATDMNYDSSFSSANNCSESNNTCAMIRQCSREFTDRQELTAAAGILNDCKRPSSNQCNAPTSDNNRSNRNQASSEGLKKRDNWDKNIEFLLAVIGFAVDLGNVWRFPYICYNNGGGAFLIPYTIMFILGGLPIFYLEMSLGQYFSSGCLTVWKWVCPMAKGVGYAMCVLNFFTGLYYNTIISWAVFFFVESFTSVLPWTSCDNQWNSDDCRTIGQRQALKTNTTYIIQSQTSLAQPVHYSSPTKDYFEREVLQVHLSKGIDDLGYIRKPLATYLAIVYVCIYFAIWKGVKSTGKAVWITALLPYFVLIPLLIRGVFLEGAWLGIKYYLYPQWLKLVDPIVWVEAAKQIYFSLGPGFGTLMALSSYNKFNHNCRRDALIAASVNYFASFISGLVIFAVLGYMATIENVSISDVATEGPGLVFQVYPEGLATMRFSSMWSVLFFIMVITLGIDSTFGGLESVITGLCDEYPRVLRAHRSLFIGCLIILIYLCSLPTTTNGGNYVIFVLESYGTLSLLFIVLIETIIVCWFYGADKFCRNLEEMYGEMPGPYWRICWKYISPTILLVIFSAACYQEYDKYYTLSDGRYTYPGWAPILGLLMTGSSVCCIPLYAIYHFKTKTSGTFLERLRIAIRPIEGDQKVEKEIYVDALTDKIRDENNPHLDTVI